MSGRKQFDVDEAVGQAMIEFWNHGYVETSLDVLCGATGLSRGSLYGAFGGKDELFRRALDRYSSTYGAQYEGALVSHPEEPVRAVEAFFEVVLNRIADPCVPDGCLIAQSVSQTPALTPETAAHVHSLLGRQRERIRAALATARADPSKLDDLALYIVAVTQSLAVMSRGGASDHELRAIVQVACAAVADQLGTRQRASA